MRSNMIVVYGISSPGGTVHINGEVAEVGRDGRFQAEVGISPGTNQIEVIAIDGAGNREREVVTVTLVPPPPFFLSVIEPQNQSVVSEHTVRLSGRTSLDVEVSVNGVFIPVDDLGIFSTKVTLRTGPNILEVIASNGAGETSTIDIAVIYSP